MPSTLLDAAPTGEPHADDALSALGEKWPPPADPLTVLWWARWRGPRRINPYVRAAVGAGVVDITDGALTVLDPGPVQAAAARLIAVLEDPAPARRDVTFVVLADAAGVTLPHLGGWSHRKQRARLRRLRHQAVRGDAGRLLRAGRKASATLSSVAETDPQDFDQQIGLTRSGRRAAAWWNGFNH